MNLNIVPGRLKKKVKGKEQKSILDVILDGVTIYVFEGAHSQFDIYIRYVEDGKRLRTPAHIHWAVDLLLKKKGNKKLADAFLADAKKYWVSCTGLPQSRDFETIKEKLLDGVGFFKIGYEPLEKYGEYTIPFMECLFVLLSVQEKTNNPNAYMFGNVVDELAKPKMDIFRIVQAASYRGRI